jgi:signal transduction histidine kinase
MSTAFPPESTPGGALAHTWRRVWRASGRHVMVVGGLCLGIALLLTALKGRGFFVHLVYSLSIGVTCTLIVDGVRLLAAGVVDRLRRRRGLPPVADFNGWLGAVPGALLAMIAGPSIGMTVGDLLTGYSSPSLFDLSSTQTRVTLALGVLGTVFSLIVISSLERLAIARTAAEAAQRQAAEHQLRLLQSQLEPHMLFNTLANLRVLIGLDAAQAQAMLDHLISFLRATLNASRQSAHPLATEFERIADYLALMGVRMGPRLQVQLDLPEALRELPVPPLLLQPLVENAIKHGLEPHVQGGRVHVVARSEHGRLVLTVRDTGTGLGAEAATDGTRFGLAQVRERLATLHGGAASLTLAPATDGQGGTCATVQLPLPGPLASSPAPSPA